MPHVFIRGEARDNKINSESPAIGQDADADLAEDVGTRKSTNVVVVVLTGGLASCILVVQTGVNSSTIDS